MTVPPFQTRAVRGRILLVENTSVFREIQVGLLRSAGYDAVACSEPDQAIREGQAQPFDAVVLNSDHAALYSIDFLASLRKQKPQLHILALVRNSNPEYTEQLLHRGISAVFERPLTPALLLQRIDAVLGFDLPPASPKLFSEVSAVDACGADRRSASPASSTPPPNMSWSAERSFLSSFGAIRQVSSPVFTVTSFTN